MIGWLFHMNGGVEAVTCTNNSNDIERRRNSVCSMTPSSFIERWYYASHLRWPPDFYFFDKPIDIHISRRRIFFLLHGTDRMVNDFQWALFRRSWNESTEGDGENSENELLLNSRFSPQFINVKHDNSRQATVRNIIFHDEAREW